MYIVYVYLNNNVWYYYYYYIIIIDSIIYESPYIQIHHVLTLVIGHYIRNITVGIASTVVQKYVCSYKFIKNENKNNTFNLNFAKW